MPASPKQRAEHATKLDRFAKLLDQGLEIPAIRERLGIGGGHAHSLMSEVRAGRSRSYRQTSDYLNYGNENTGQDAFMLAKKEAELGSAALREAVTISMQRFADRYHISEHDARILLLDTGVRL